MKMTTQDFERLQDLVNQARETLASFAEYKALKLSPMRYRWDAFHRAHDLAMRKDDKSDYMFLRNLSDYLNDNNLDTALRKIVTI